MCILFSAMNQVNLLIFDECHNCSGNSPYALLMKQHYDKSENAPRILGLSASLSPQKIKANKLMESAKHIQELFWSDICKDHVFLFV